MLMVSHRDSSCVYIRGDLVGLQNGGGGLWKAPRCCGGGGGGGGTSGHSLILFFTNSHSSPENEEFIWVQKVF